MQNTKKFFLLTTTLFFSVLSADIKRYKTCKVSVDSVGEAIKVLKANNPKDKILVCNNIFNKDQSVDKLVDKFAKELGKNKTITQLDISDNYIKPNRILIIFQELKNNKTLKKLDLGDNKIGPVAMEY